MTDIKDLEQLRTLYSQGCRVVLDIKEDKIDIIQTGVLQNESERKNEDN